MTRKRNYQKYYINVAKLMRQSLPRPSLKKNIFKDKDELIPIISVDVGKYQ